MRKQSKSLISMILTAAMVVTLGTGAGVSNNASADDAAATPIDPSFEAYLCSNGDDGKVFDFTTIKFDDGKEAAVVASSGAITQTGTYTLSAVATDSYEDLFSTEGEGTSYLGVEFGTLGETEVDGKKNYILPTTYSIKPKSIKIEHVDGSADTELDWSQARVYNNSQKVTQKLRIGIFNKYAESTSGSGLQDAIDANPFWKLNAGNWGPAVDAVSIEPGDTFSVIFEVTADAPTITPTPVPTPTPTAPPAAKSYKAYLGFQTDNYIYRDTWNNSGSNKYYKHDTQIAIAEGGKGRAINATIKNEEIKDNTTYTVSISGANLKTLKSSDDGAKTATQFNMLYVDTNIPLTMKNVSAVNASLKIDGQLVKDKMTLPCKPDADGYYQLMVADAYSDTDGIKNVPYPKESALKTLPTSSIEITFTMKGVDFKQDFETKEIGVQKGKTFTAGSFKYKVTKAATITAGKTAQGTVTVVGLTSKGKKAGSLSVGKTVSKTVNKIKATYKINKLGNNVFKGAKAKTVTLSKNIKSIPKGAFANCKKLSTLNLKAKISVKKGAFKGCKKTIKVKGTSKKANLKKLKKSGYKKFK